MHAEGDRGKQQAAMGIAAMAASERHFVAASAVPLFLLRHGRRFGCGHDAAWDGGYLVPRMRSENQHSRRGVRQR